MRKLKLQLNNLEKTNKEEKSQKDNKIYINIRALDKITAKTSEIRLTIGEKKFDAELLWTEKKDRPKLKKLYKAWVELKNGLKEFESRAPNLPEGISEGAFSLEFNCPRVLDVRGTAASYDCYNTKTHERIQIKATTIRYDLTSFGPDSVYRDGKFDGKYDVYKIPNDLIYNHQISRTQTFRDQQNEKRRPRFGIKKSIIELHDIKPTKTCQI